MKILEVVLSLTSGGAERLVVDLCNELSNQEDVTLLVLKDLRNGENGFYMNDVSSRVKIVNLGFKDGFNASYLFKVFKAVRSINPDIVHIHSASDKYCLLPIMFHPKSMKFIQTIHNDVKSYCDLLHKFIIKILGRLGRISFVTISQKNYEDFNAYYPSVSNALIYNGRAELQKTEKFQEVKTDIDSLKKDSSTKVILHVARCARQKNQQLLINSFNKWIGSGANAILLVCGAAYDSEFGKNLKAIAGDRVHFLGEKNNISDYLFNCDAFVLSSLYEGMPITVLEAMSLKIPVLSTPVCGVVDVIENGVNGYISKDFTEESFLDMLNSFGKDFLGIKEDVPRNISNRFSISQCATSYRDLFRSKLSTC